MTVSVQFQPFRRWCGHLPAPGVQWSALWASQMKYKDIKTGTGVKPSGQNLGSSGTASMAKKSQKNLNNIQQQSVTFNLLLKARSGKQSHNLP